MEVKNPIFGQLSDRHFSTLYVHIDIWCVNRKNLKIALLFFFVFSKMYAMVRPSVWKQDFSLKRNDKTSKHCGPSGNVINNDRKCIKELKIDSII